MEPIMTTHRLQDPTFSPSPARGRTGKTRSAYVLTVVALVAAACSDNAPPTSPEAVQTVATVGPTPARDSRTPYISDLQLHSIYVDMAHGGIYDNAYDFVLTNPGPKSTGLYLQSELQQNQYTVNAGATTIFCPAPDGVLQHGTCRMQFAITPPPTYLALAPARFTLRLMQRGTDNSIRVLDSRTVDVVIVHS
jgi:hypothetical protein